MWKLLTGIFADRIYDHFADKDLLPGYQKGGRKNYRGTKDQLLIDKAITTDEKNEIFATRGVKKGQKNEKFEKQHFLYYYFL